MTLHGLIEELTEELKLTPEQQFRLTAKIKRLIHHEKANVFHRYFLYSRGRPIFDKPYDPKNPGQETKIVGYEPAADEWLNGLLEGKYKQHAELATLPDEEIVTWNVGSHRWKPKT